MNNNENKIVYEVLLYNNGQFKINESENEIITNGVFWCCEKEITLDGEEIDKPLALMKQCYKENIQKTKKYLVNKRIKDCNKELNKIKQQLSIYKTTKSQIDNDK